MRSGSLPERECVMREMELEGIEHRTVEVNGIMMHVAENGKGPVVLFLHGFPELWYSWHHRTLYLAAHGYRAVAPDLCGYGDTAAPPDITAYSIFYIIALIDSLGQNQVFVVGHDWGAIVVWHLYTFRPNKCFYRSLVLWSSRLRIKKKSCFPPPAPHQLETVGTKIMFGCCTVDVLKQLSSEELS